MLRTEGRSEDMAIRSPRPCPNAQFFTGFRADPVLQVRTQGRSEGMTIHQNKKDGGMLIVKTVLCEFAFAACNDS